MNAFLALAVMILGAALLVALPLAPAVVELRRKSDAEPLRVVHEHAGEIRYFADGFRQYVGALEPVIQRSAESGRASPGSMRDGTRYLVLGSSSESFLQPAKERGSCDVLIAAANDLRLPAGVSFAKDIFAKGNVFGEAGNQYRSIFGEQNIHLSASSVVLRWTHANAKFTADQGCTLYGRVSSNRCLRLAVDCAFSRLNAPRIELGHTGHAEANAVAAFLPQPSNQPIPERQLLDGDFKLHEGQVFHGNLIVRGKLRIGRGARIYGSVKSGKDLQVEEDVAVSGSLMSARNMSIGRNCSIHGPVIAERKIAVRTGSQCGAAESPTTVSAPRIVVEEGSVVFGTLWAREAGCVVAK